MSGRHRLPGGKRGWKRGAALVGVASVMTLTAGASAYADNLVADGDALTTSFALDLGTVCVDQPTSTSVENVTLGITRQGNYATSQVFKKGTTATVSVLSSSSSALSSAITGGGVINIPSNWDTAANNTVAGTAKANVSLNSSSVGPFTGTVTFRATGTQAKDDSVLERDDVLTVTATVSDTGVCAPAPSDSTPPDISYVLNPETPDGDNGWYTSDVTLSWTVTENESPSSLVKTGCITQNITADQAEQTYSCSATSDGGSAGPVDVKIKRDASAPTVALVGGPASGGDYYFGSVPGAPTCTASDNGPSGLAGNCAVTGYDTSVGTHTVTATATDNAGNGAVDSHTYTVKAWTLAGFYSPVDMGDTWNTVKGGSTVPLKFEVFAAAELTDTSAVESFTVNPILCPGASALADPIEFVTTGGTSLRYDATSGQFVQNWQTPKRPGTCYAATMKTDDQSSITAKFILK